ncbi:c-type cytochrome domain-containing protein, partial [Cyclobacterium jeungdonense]|nr:c-type cytochrome domain-containing protein [Cyclobacterium jeungdonense]
MSCSEDPSEGIGLNSTDQVSYNFHVRPILSDNCYACHGPDENKREAGLRLDMAESAYAALKENPDAHAIVPGKPGSSEVVRRLESTDAMEMMPPPESNLKLTEEEKGIIRKWIRQGAEYQPHWAFVPPVKS